MAQQKFAFPGPREFWNDETEKWEFQQGMTMRQFYAAQAPREIPAWFEPVMPPLPPYGKGFISGDGQRYYTDKSEAERIEGDDFYFEGQQERNEWHKNLKKQRIAQWPWAWADLVLGAENTKPDDGPQAD